MPFVPRPSGQIAFASGFLGGRAFSTCLAVSRVSALDVSFSVLYIAMSNGSMMTCAFPSFLAIASACRVHSVHHVCMNHNYHSINASGVSRSVVFGAWNAPYGLHCSKRFRLLHYLLQCIVLPFKWLRDGVYFPLTPCHGISPQGLREKGTTTGKFLRSFFQKATRRRHS